VYNVRTAFKQNTYFVPVLLQAVQKVVLSGHQPRRPLPPPSGEDYEAYTIMETVLRCAPSPITVNVAYEQSFGTPPHYTLWKVSDRCEPVWQVFDEDWCPRRILLPNRKFSGTPLGDLYIYERNFRSMNIEKRGLRWLTIETYARYAFNGVIRCPRLDCDATFAERSQWSKHLDREHHHLGYEDAGNTSADELFWFTGTPDAVKAALEARHQCIKMRDR
jgi:hypothetical protein